MASRVVEAFLAAWRGPAGPAMATLEDELQALIATARAANPSIDVGELDFASLLAERAADVPGHSLDQLAAADLWLALACASGNPIALRALEARTFPNARSALHRMGMHDADVDEVLQIVRERLLVSTPDQPAGILKVAGRGDLGGLIRVAATRTALNLRRRDHRLEVGDERLFAALTSHEDDPQRAVMKEDLRAAFKAAVETAVRGLEPWQRNVLRMHFLHALSIDAIGRAYQVHRATAARWLSSIRSAIQAQTWHVLHDQMQLNEGDLASIFAEVQSRVELSFARMLASSADAAVPDA